MNAKAILRAELRAARRAFVNDPAWRCDTLVFLLMLAERVVGRFGDARAIALYVSDGEEVDPLPILLQAVDRGLATALPRVIDRASPLTFHHWLPGDELVAGPFGLVQPRADAPEVEPDLILAPLVGFDRQLQRLGQGAGHYDRAFARYPAARRIGLAWSVQEAEELPLDPWDFPLHGIATEREWIGGEN